MQKHKSSYTKHKLAYVFKTNNGDFAIAYMPEQQDCITKIGKMILHLYQDEQLLVKKGDKPIIKSQQLFTFIRLTD